MSKKTEKAAAAAAAATAAANDAVYDSMSDPEIEIDEKPEDDHARTASKVRRATPRHNCVLPCMSGRHRHRGSAVCTYRRSWMTMKQHMLTFPMHV